MLEGNYSIKSLRATDQAEVFDVLGLGKRPKFTYTSFCTAIQIENISYSFHETAHNKDVGLFWFLEKDIAVEFFKCILFLFFVVVVALSTIGCGPSKFHCVWDKADISTADTKFSYTKTIKMYWKKKEIQVKRRIYIFDFGGNCPFTDFAVMVSIK